MSSTIPTQLFKDMERAILNVKGKKTKQIKTNKQTKKNSENNSEQQKKLKENLNPWPQALLQSNIDFFFKNHVVLVQKYIGQSRE